MVHISPADIEYQKAHIQDDRRSNIIVSHAMCLPVAIAAVVLRLVSRRIGRIKLQWDDFIIIIALVFALGEVTAGFLCVRFGGGRHAISLKDPATFAKVRPRGDCGEVENSLLRSSIDSSNDGSTLQPSNSKRQIVLPSTISPSLPFAQTSYCAVHPGCCDPSLRLRTDYPCDLPMYADPRGLGHKHQECQMHQIQRYCHDNGGSELCH